jgi:hypothetical protein
MENDYELVQNRIKRIYYFNGSTLGIMGNAILPAVLLALFYKYILLNNIAFLQKKYTLYLVFIALVYIITLIFMFKKRNYIQWDKRNIRFKNINGYTAIVGVDRIKSINIKNDKGIYITHENFYDEKMNGTYLIPFEGLGKNYDTDVKFIIEDFKKLYPDLIID